VLGFFVLCLVTVPTVTRNSLFLAETISTIYCVHPRKMSRHPLSTTSIIGRRLLDFIAQGKITEASSVCMNLLTLRLSNVN